MREGPYHQPLRLQVENVKLEKEKASLTAMLNDFVEQRNGFQANADALCVEVVRQQEELGQLKAQVTEMTADQSRLAKERSAKDAEQEQMRQRWGMQLEQAEREFNEMRSQLIAPAELEAMRFQLMEETEVPWRNRTQALEKELEQTRSALAAQKRETEQLKEALDIASHECASIWPR